MIRASFSTDNVGTVKLTLTLTLNLGLLLAPGCPINNQWEAQRIHRRRSTRLQLGSNSIVSRALVRRRRLADARSVGVTLRRLLVLILLLFFFLFLLISLLLGLFLFCGAVELREHHRRHEGNGAAASAQGRSGFGVSVVE
jgi:hypothetical protein